jgi:hypothetical protein
LRGKAITCRICGARCSCKGASGGICCSCHPHKRKRLTARVMLMDRREMPDSWLVEIAAIEAEIGPQPQQLRLFQEG